MPRRERWSVLGAILDALETGGTPGANGPVLTRVATRANLPYDRLVIYLEQMATAGLVTDSKKPQLTDKGREFLRHYRQWSEMLERFGLR